jgi:pyridoxamine 5'-phosphate oxidase family protein
VLSLILFSKPEEDYIKSQRLARVATASKKGQPDVVPVGFEFDGTYFWVGSHDQNIFFRTRKYHNVKNGNNLVSLVVDDLKSVDPWHPRAVKVYGTAEVMDHKGIFGPGKYIRITPTLSWSMGIEGLPLKEGEWRLKTVHNS